MSTSPRLDRKQVGGQTSLLTSEAFCKHGMVKLPTRKMANAVIAGFQRPLGITRIWQPAMKCLMAKCMATYSLDRILPQEALTHVCNAKHWSNWTGWLYAISTRSNRLHSGISNLDLGLILSLLIRARSRQKYFSYPPLPQPKKRDASRIHSVSYNGETKRLTRQAMR